MKAIILDCFFFLGLAFLAFGLYQYNPIFMFITIGILFIFFSLATGSGIIKVRIPFKGGR